VPESDEETAVSSHRVFLFSLFDSARLNLLLPFVPSQYLTKRGPHAFYELGFYTETDGGKEGLEIEEGSRSRFVFKRV